jgi:hypothetical protein
MVLRTVRVAAVLAAAVLTASCSGSAATKAGGSAAASSPRTSTSTGGTDQSAPGSATVPRFDHIVVVVLENHAYSQLIGRGSAPFLNSLADRGAVLTNFYALTHPSEPNYLAMFSGSTHGLSDDSCPHSYTGPNLAASLLAAGQSFTGYSEDLPEPGFTGCSAGAYARKHNPWVNFAALPAGINQPLTAFPEDLSRLPNVAFVIPNLDNDMHDGSVAQGDRWLRAHLGEYADWSVDHNSLLIVTADEDDRDHHNRIATVFTGAHVRSGKYPARTDHYGLLATLLASCRLRPFEAAARARPITAIWAQ